MKFKRVHGFGLVPLSQFTAACDVSRGTVDAPDYIAHNTSASPVVALTTEEGTEQNCVGVYGHRVWGTCNNRTMVPHKEIQWNNSTPQGKFYRLGTKEKTIKYPTSAMYQVRVRRQWFYSVWGSGPFCGTLGPV